jgi:long-chain acyl-CoA synthetase
MVKTLVNTPFTIFSALDTLYSHLLQSEDFKTNKYPYYKYGIAGGMRTRTEIAEEWFKLTGVMPANCYGLSESSPAVTLNPLDNTFDGSVGFPVPSMQLEIRNLQTNQVLIPGEVGQIWIKGPQVTKGYWNNEEKTKAAFDENGWFATKDLGYLTPLGKLVLSGRASEMIIVSGFNVYPVEIEEVLNSFPEIDDAAVIGLPDEKTGECVVAFVALVKGQHTLKPDEIIQRCKKELAAYKVPHYIYIRDNFPKTLVGKIDKKILKQDLLNAGSR